MTWTAVAGKSPVQTPGNVVTLATVTDSVSGKSFEGEYRNDGTDASLVAAIRAALGKVDPATARVTTVAPGTVLDISDPAPPPPPTKEEQDRAQFFADLRADRQQAKLDALPAALRARCLPDYVESL